MHTTFPTRLVAVALAASVTVSAFAIGAAYVKTTEAQETTGSVPQAVTVENFIRAESDLYFKGVAVGEVGFGKFEHHRELASIDHQNVIRMNRDTTAQKDADGSVTAQFGGCDGQVPNCLPVEAGWNYLVRLYRPQQPILDGTWEFPDAQPVS